MKFHDFSMNFHDFSRIFAIARALDDLGDALHAAVVLPRGREAARALVLGEDRGRRARAALVHVTGGSRSQLSLRFCSVSGIYTRLSATASESALGRDGV